MPLEIGYHWYMLNDHDRNDAYRDAIRDAAPGRIVYDLGAGVGPMSYYALTAGARRVYGFEVDRDIYPYLRRLRQAFPNFVPLRVNALHAALPHEMPDVVVCEMWSAWLTDWPMVRVLNRIRRRIPRVEVIPVRGHHMVQLVEARHRSGLPVQFAPGTEAALFGEPHATAEMSIPVLVAVTDFRRRVPPVDSTIELIPLTTGTVNAVRLYSYEEVSAGRILPRTGTRTDELLRWIGPIDVRRGRRVRLRVKHRWDTGLRVRVE
jgi:predicted RNA methylase